MFVSGRPGAFPPPQFVRQLAAVSGETGVALLGDAAHAFPPDLGQGVNSALEDAHVLAGCVAEALREEGDIPDGATQSGRLLAAIGRYQRERGPAAEALARIARIGFPYQYGQGPGWRQALFTLGFGCRLALSKLSSVIFAPPAAFQILAGEPYVRIWRRCERTTRLLQALGLLAMVGVALRRFAAVAALV